MRYLARRLANAVVLLFGVSVLSFALLSLAPGSFFEEMRLNPQVSDATIAGLRTRYGLDRPMPVRYADWVRSVTHGDFGYSLAYNAPAGPLIWARARNTLALTTVAMAIAWLLAVPIGIGMAWWRAAARMFNAATSLLLAIPELLLALLLLMFAARTGLARVGGSGPLAVAALVLGVLPVLVRHVRAAVAEELGATYIRAARAHGIRPTRLLFHHALRAAANPLISLFGFSVGSLLSGSLIVEVVLGWPGLGPFLLEAILGRDLFVVIDATLFSTVFLTAGNLLADVILYAADPRIRVAGR